MSYKPGDNYYKVFTTSNPTTGAAQNADSLPTATATHNGADDVSFTLTVVNLDTGRYLISGTIPAGYAAGDTVNVTVTATVNSITAKSCVQTFQLDSKRWADVIGAEIPSANAGAANGLLIAGTNAGVTSFTGGIAANIAGSITSVTNGVTVATNLDKTAYSLAQAFPANFAALGISAGGAVLVDGTSPLTEDYTTDAFTLAQALYEIAQVVGQNSISGTTIIVQKRDKTSIAATYTLDSSTSPTLRTRAT